MARSRRCPGQVPEYRLTLRHTGIAIALAQKRARARLVQSFAKIERARHTAAQSPFPTTDRPAANHLGKFGHIGLGISAVDTERVQLEDLARQVLVDAKL